jgi:hypothetical protein
MTRDPKDGTYSEKETEERAARTLAKLLSTPHKPHKDRKKERHD